MILLLTYIAYKFYKRFEISGQDNDWQYDITKFKDSQNLNRSISPEYFDEETLRSPISSDKSDTSFNLLKKRRSYDKSYRTHEPLKGLPQIEFEEKPMDPNMPEYEPETNTLKSNVRSTNTSSTKSPTSSVLYSTPYSTKPDLLTLNNKDKLYGDDNYAVPLKKSQKPRFSSSSSIITDV